MSPQDASNASAPQTPALEVPLESLFTGGYAYPRTSLDQASGRIAILQDEQHVSLWHQVVYESADWLLLLCLIAVPLLLSKVWGILRTPRARGRLTCRRCTYDLAPVGSQPPERCPECGTSTVERRPVLGRSTASRLAGPLVLLVLVVGATTVVSLTTLERQGPFSMGRAWPPLISRYLPAWAVRVHREPPTKTSGRIDIWSISERRLLRTVGADAFGGGSGRLGVVGDMQLLAKGELLALTTLENGITTRVIRVSDGAVVWERSSSPFSAVRLAGVAGAAADGSTVYVWSFSRTNANEGDVKVEEVSLPGGAVWSIGSLHIDHDIGAWGMLQVFAAETRGVPVWGAVEQTAAGGAVMLSDRPLLKTPPIRTISVSLRAGPDGEPMVVLPLSGKTPATGPAWEVPLNGQDVRTVTLDSLTASGTTLTVTPGGTGGARSFPSGRTAVRSIRAILPGDRWTVVVVDEVKQPLIPLPGGGGTPQGLRGFLQVWDLSPAPASSGTADPSAPPGR